MSGFWHILTAPFRRGPRRPLATRQPGREEMGQTRKIPLGMEALDMRIVDEANKRNDALERASGVFHQRNMLRSGIASANTSIDPMNDDETYAARFYGAYIKKEN